VSVLAKRVEALEAATGGDGGCHRCSGTLVVVSNAMTGEFHSASWRGEALSEEETRQRRAETRCPKCGRRLEAGDAPVIQVGGLRYEA
jgi:uncharacterized protein with PIN domain